MKLVTFTTASANEPKLGAWSDAGILDLQAAASSKHGTTSALSSMQALIEGGPTALDIATELAQQCEAQYALADVTLMSPLPVPVQIRDCMGFEQHLINAYGVMRKRAAAKHDDPAKALAEFEAKGLFQVPDVWYRQPVYYKANRFSVIGTEADVRWPAYCKLLDFELEYAAVIGKPGSDIAKEDAHSHIFGYTIFNDVSARDAQGVEMQGMLGPAKGKDFDTGNIFGPCIVTSDAIDPYNLSMKARVNGEEWSSGHSSTMHWRFDDLIAHISKSETLHPGELIGSGTVGGGCGLELERYLNPDDVVELEVEHIGILRNRMVK
jgi:2-keto-4-pentenoate hydratase/2-oxohepta-3-ene-1,7-dioic acid hydratase in catechol pathway